MDFSRLKKETRPIEMRRKSFSTQFWKKYTTKWGWSKRFPQNEAKKEKKVQKLKKKYFDQQRGCAALDRWSKYTTNGITWETKFNANISVCQITKFLKCSSPSRMISWCPSFSTCNLYKSSTVTFRSPRPVTLLLMK